MHKQVRVPSSRLEKWQLYEQTILVVLFIQGTLGNDTRKDKHHLVPRSRCKQWGIEPRFEGNIIRISRLQHNAWHALFHNLIAEEVLYLIAVQGWRPITQGQKAAWRIIFGSSAGNLSRVKRALRTKWSARNGDQRVWRTVQTKFEQELGLTSTRFSNRVRFLFTIFGQY